MSLFLVLQVPVIQFVLGMTQDRPSHHTDGVTAFHASFLSLDSSQNYSRLTVFLTKGKIFFHVSIFSLVRLGNGFAYGSLSFGHDSTYRPRPTYYVAVLVFTCLYVCMTLAFTSLYQCSHVLTDATQYKLMNFVNFFIGC